MVQNQQKKKKEKEKKGGGVKIAFLCSFFRNDTLEAKGVQMMAT